MEVARINSTESPIEQYDCTWTVDDFIRTLTRDWTFSFSSPMFSTGAVRWTMNIGVSSYLYDYHSVGVGIDPRCLRDDDEHVIAKYELGVCTVRGRVVKDPADGRAIYSHSRRLDAYEIFDKTTTGSDMFRHFIRRSKLSDLPDGLLIDGALTLNLQISFVGSSMRLARYVGSRPADGATLSENLRRPLMNSLLSDVTIVVDDGRRIPAHKVILAARSPVFAVMFEHTVKDIVEIYRRPPLHRRLQPERRSRVQNEVKIDDVDGEVVDTMLEYIYTGQLDGDISAVGERLLVAADKYDLPDLKFLCKDKLLDNLSADNAWELLVVAEMHRFEELKAAAIDAVLQKHDTEITKTAGWKKILDNKACHPIVDEIMAASIRNSAKYNQEY